MTERYKRNIEYISGQTNQHHQTQHHLLSDSFWSAQLVMHKISLGILKKMLPRCSTYSKISNQELALAIETKNRYICRIKKGEDYNQQPVVQRLKSLLYSKFLMHCPSAENQRMKFSNQLNPEWPDHKKPLVKKKRKRSV